MSPPQASVADLKRSIASSYPDFEARATTAWHEIIKELDNLARVIKEEGVNVSRWMFMMRSTSQVHLPIVHSSGQFQLARQSFPR